MENLKKFLIKTNYSDELASQNTSGIEDKLQSQKESHSWSYILTDFLISIFLYH